MKVISLDYLWHLDSLVVFSPFSFARMVITSIENNKEGTVLRLRVIGAMILVIMINTVGIGKDMCRGI
jgi:hypothetical protein